MDSSFSYPHRHPKHEIDAGLREIAVNEVFAVFLTHVSSVNPGIAAIAVVEDVVYG